MITLQFEYEKETPGAVRYKEVRGTDDSYWVGTLYLRKSKLGDMRPKTMTISLDLEQPRTGEGG